MLLLTPVVLTFLWSAEPTIPGRVDAMNDLRSGRLVLETAGLPAPESGEYWQLLKDRYQIEMRGVAGCIVDSSDINHIHGYNAVMTAAIDRRFGKGTLDRAWKEAQRKYRAQFSKPKKQDK